MSNFQAFAAAVALRFTQLSKHELFVVDITGDEVYEAYQSAFPPGTNEIYRERREHDCSTCKNFIRNIGNVVAVVNGSLMSIWRIPNENVDVAGEYLLVAETLDELIKSKKIVGVFRTKELDYGAQFSLEGKNGENVKKWNHFHTGHIPARFFTKTPDAVRGKYAENVAMRRRAFEELSDDALNTVADLIETDAIYRGAEHKTALLGFIQARNNWYANECSDTMLWRDANDMATSRFRNTVIGTLVQDLSAGMPVEDAVRAFETKVAPANYKRTAALITPGMVKEAVKKLDELGLTDVVQRRFAKLSDVNVQDVLWVDGTKRDVMKHPVLKGLLDAAKPRNFKHTWVGNSMSIEGFMEQVLPTAKAVEIMVKNTHQNNFVSLTAPASGESDALFAWPNAFGWSYAGNVTDSIKERVKKAGGNTGAPLRVSLAWSNTDDLDIHALSPEGHVFFGDPKGILDVDMNRGFSLVRDPVENLSWTRPRNGNYKIIVSQYNQRETIDVGFTLELENEGKVQQWSYAKPVKGQIEVLSFGIVNAVVRELRVLNTDLVGGAQSKKRWGVDTETFVKVNTVLLSPNYWGDSAVGNKHYIFALDGCVNDEPTRGIYNEYLNPCLTPHRKVFEVLGSQTLCPPASEQVSGVGFSSTRHDTVQIRADGRVYNVTF